MNKPGNEDPHSLLRLTVHNISQGPTKWDILIGDDGDMAHCKPKNPPQVVQEFISGVLLQDCVMNATMQLRLNFLCLEE